MLHEFFRRLSPLAVILTIQSLLIAYVIKIFYPISIYPQKILIFELLNISTNNHLAITFLFSIFSTILFFLILKRESDGFWLFLATAIFSVNPLLIYLTAFNSTYILFLPCILLIILGYQSRKERIGKGLLFLGSVLLSISSFYSLLILLILALISFSDKYLKRLIILTITLIILLAGWFSFQNSEALKNVMNQHIRKEVLVRQGSLNAVNQLRGEAKSRNQENLARLTENKYLYLFKESTITLLNSLNPVYLFTLKANFLQFSFNPPFFLPLLIPFLVACFHFIQKKKKILIYSFVLFLPGVFSSGTLKQQTLILIYPFIIYAISLGLNLLWNQKNKISKLLVTLIIICLFANLIVSVFDLQLREYQRFTAHYKKYTWEIKD